MISWLIDVHISACRKICAECPNINHGFDCFACFIAVRRSRIDSTVSLQQNLLKSNKQAAEFSGISTFWNISEHMHTYICSELLGTQDVVFSIVLNSCNPSIFEKNKHNLMSYPFYNKSNGNFQQWILLRLAQSNCISLLHFEVCSSDYPSLFKYVQLSLEWSRFYNVLTINSWFWFHAWYRKQEVSAAWTRPWVLILPM